MWMGCDSISIMRKCAWCGEDFPVKSLFSRDKYCDLHKKEAKLERDRLKKRDKKNKSKIMMRVGTDTTSPHLRLIKPVTYLGCDIPFTEFIQEQKVIQNLKKHNNRGSINSKNKWLDHDTNYGKIEYGETQPCGILNTHNYATLDDYYHTAKHYLLKDRGECPECGCKEHYKTDIDVSCAECGLILESNTNLMGATDVDVVDSENTKKRKNIDCPNCDKEITVILNSKSVLKDKYVKCKYCGFIIQYELKDDLLKIVGAFSTVQDIAWKKYRQGK